MITPDHIVALATTIADLRIQIADQAMQIAKLEAERAEQK